MKQIEKKVSKLQEMGFGNQSRIIGAKRVELYSVFRKALQDTREEVIEEINEGMIKIKLNDHRAISWNKLYATPHWTKRKLLADEIHFLMKLACKNVKKISKQVNILIVAKFKGKRALDSSNICLKLYEDGLVKAGVIVDDSPEYVRMVTMESVPESGEDSVEIFVNGTDQL